MEKYPQYVYLGIPFHEKKKKMKEQIKSRIDQIDIEIRQPKKETKKLLLISDEIALQKERIELIIINK